MSGTENGGSHQRRITDLVDSLRGAGPHRCVAVEQAAVRFYKEALMRRLTEKDGTLNAEDVEAVARQCSHAPHGLSLLASKSYNACTEASRDAAHDGQRVDPFGRLIIETFSHLLANKGEQRNQSIDRAHLPNFFKVLRAMIGDETIWARKRICQAVLNELRFEHGNDFIWRLYYDDSRTREVLAQTVADFVAHFEDFDHRVHWFLDVMNSRPPTVERENDETRSTDFSEENLVAMARAMIKAAGLDLDSAIRRRTDRPIAAFLPVIQRFAEAKPVRRADAPA